VLLEILAAIERMGIDPDPLGPDAGTMALIVRAARVDRDRHLADPEAMRVHVSTLLDDGHIAALTDEVRARTVGVPVHGASHPGDTIGLVTADAEGNAVSLIQSLYNGLGSGILEPATGIVPHSRGAQFVLDPDHSNVLAPRKRPSHTLMPAMAHRDGRAAVVLGTMGGQGQPQINATNLLRVADLDLSAVDALASPRWLVGGLDEGDGWILAEDTVPASVIEDLAEAGFRVDRIPGPSGELGHSHLIRVRADGSFEVGSDPRADGGAMAS
jgi:gamma-glutamyltranspeptidase/glutathione hydrolase